MKTSMFQVASVIDSKHANVKTIDRLINLEDDDMLNQYTTACMKRRATEEYLQDEKEIQRSEKEAAKAIIKGLVKQHGKEKALEILSNNKEIIQKTGWARLLRAAWKQL